jgi:hypothetical protein
MVVAVVKAAAMPMAAIGDSEHAIDCTDRTTNTCSHRLADHAADGTGNPITFVPAFLSATHDALRVSDMGDRQQCECERRAGKISGAASRFRSYSSCSSEFLVLGRD